MKVSALERQLVMQITASQLPRYETQYRWLPTRRFRADFAWPARKILVEVQGGIWTGGRHTRGDGYEQDCEKLNLAQLNGWRVFYVTGKMIKSGEAISTIEKAVSLGKTMHGLPEAKIYQARFENRRPIVRTPSARVSRFVYCPRRAVR